MKSFKKAIFLFAASLCMLFCVQSVNAQVYASVELASQLIEEYQEQPASLFGGFDAASTFTDITGTSTTSGSTVDFSHIDRPDSWLNDMVRSTINQIFQAIVNENDVAEGFVSYHASHIAPLVGVTNDEKSEDALFVRTETLEKIKVVLQN